MPRRRTTWSWEEKRVALLANISQLDREAAEILERRKARERAVVESRFYEEPKETEGRTVVVVKEPIIEEPVIEAKDEERRVARVRIEELDEYDATEVDTPQPVGIVSVEKEPPQSKEETPRSHLMRVNSLQEPTIKLGTSTQLERVANSASQMPSINEVPCCSASRRGANSADAACPKPNVPQVDQVKVSIKSTQQHSPFSLNVPCSSVSGAIAKSVEKASSKPNVSHVDRHRTGISFSPQTLSNEDVSKSSVSILRNYSVTETPARNHVPHVEKTAVEIKLVEQAGCQESVLKKKESQNVVNKPIQSSKKDILEVKVSETGQTEKASLKEETSNEGAPAAKLALVNGLHKENLRVNALLGKEQHLEVIKEENVKLAMVRQGDDEKHNPRENKMEIPSAEDVRKARLAYFEGKETQTTVGGGESKKEGLSRVEERARLREMLKDLKHSLPKREAYLVKREIRLEEIRVRKVSSAAQTSAAVVRTVAGLSSTPGNCQEVTKEGDGISGLPEVKKLPALSQTTEKIPTVQQLKGPSSVLLQHDRELPTLPQNGEIVSQLKPTAPTPQVEKGHVTSQIEVGASALPQMDGTSSLPQAEVGSPTYANIAPPIKLPSSSQKDEEVNRLLKKLEEAIKEGNRELAARLARDLALLRVECSVTRQKPTSEDEIRVQMFIEDRVSQHGPIDLRLQVDSTVGDLKEKLEREFGVPRAAQRWILGRGLAKDDSAPIGVKNGDPVFLYLIGQAPFIGAPKDLEDAQIKQVVDKEPTNTQSCLKVSTGKVMSSVSKIEDPKSLRKVTTTSAPLASTANQDPGVPSEASSGTTDNWWKCNVCTLVNSPSQPGCAACTTDRPKDYLVTNDQAAKFEDDQLTKEREAAEEAKKNEAEKLKNYQRLIDLEKDDVVASVEEFECPVCLLITQPFDGVVLRECLHTFCRECLAQTVQFSDEAEVKCPFRDKDYTCSSTLLEREIKAIVKPEVYEEHLAKSIALAETKIQNAFHCKTPDCRGWAIYEDNVNIFKCPVCTHINCLTCQAIHEGLDCKQFQEQLEQHSPNSEDAKRTKEMLKEMVERGEAMNCPTCQVVLMKKWGCDWLRCSMCKTEICWVTRGPRWGPNGKGDVSAGCQCGVNGVKCHPKCNYCH